MSGPSSPTKREVRAAVDAALAASKALVGVAARSLSALDDDLTLGQFRALLLVVEERATGPGDLATLLEVHPSNAGRLVDRLEAKGLLRREDVAGDRRSVSIVATDQGREVVQRVLTQRRAVLEEILGSLEADLAIELASALSAFAEAAGEEADVPADDAWRLGWGS